jgi:hypothetical protein
VATKILHLHHRTVLEIGPVTSDPLHYDPGGETFSLARQHTSFGLQTTAADAFTAPFGLAIRPVSFTTGTLQVRWSFLVGPSPMEIHYGSRNTALADRHPYSNHPLDLATWRVARIRVVE